MTSAHSSSLSPGPWRPTVRVVNYALYPGGHDWQLWHAHLNQMLVLASRDTRRPLRAGTGAHTA